MDAPTKLDPQLEEELMQKGAAPSDEEVASTYAAPAEKSLLPHGIQYVAVWKEEADGMAKHAREQILSLASSGLPVCLVDASPRLRLNSELSPEANEAAYLQDITFPDTFLLIRQFIFGRPDKLREAVCPLTVRRTMPEAVERISKSTIIYTSWERDRVHPDYVELLQDIGQLWVPCAANKRAFVKSGVDPKKVKIVPYPYDPKACTIAAPRGVDRVPSHTRFYNIGKWEPRKNQHQLIGAFLLAFKPKDTASLFIKTSPYGGAWANYPTPQESVAFWLSQADIKERGWNEKTFNSRVRIVDKKVPGSDIIRMHAENNIYVSPSLGEAWDIPAFEAKLAGNALVHVGYGGSEDYAEESDVNIEHSFGPVHPGYMWETDAEWASVKMEDFVVALQAAKSKERRIVPPQYYGSYSRHAVGLLMREYIQELATELGCWDRLDSCGGFG